MDNAISGNNSTCRKSTVGDFSGYTLSDKNTISKQIISAKEIDSGSRLPIEILVKIFIHCSLQDMGSLVLVNRLYCSAVYDALLSTLFLNKIRTERKKEITKVLIEEGITETPIEQKITKILIEEAVTRADVKQNIIQFFASDEFKYAFAGNLEFFKIHPTAHYVFHALFKNSRLDRFCEVDLLHAGKLLLNFDKRYVERMPSSLIDMGICTPTKIIPALDSNVSTEDIDLSTPFDEDQWDLIINEIPTFFTYPQKLNIKEFRKIPHQVLKEGIIKQATGQTDRWLKAFLNAGMRINHSDFQEYVPSMLRMIKNGFIDRFKLLLALGVDKDLYISGCGSFLNYALQIRSISIAEYLIKMGADLNVLDKDGNAALHIAFYARDFSEIEIGAYFSILDESGNVVPPITFNSECPPDIIKLLVQNGANVNLRNAKEKTLLQSLLKISSYAVALRWSSICRPNNIAADSGEAQYLSEALRMDLLKCLLEKQVNLEEKNKQGETALQMAFRVGCSPDVIKLFVENGANVNVRDAKEETLLQSLLNMSSHSVALHWRYICCPDRTLCINSKEEYLAEELRMDLLICLLEYGALLSRVDAKENRALPFAFRTKFSLDIWCRLLQKGANPDVRDREGKTLLQVLMEMDHAQMGLHWRSSCSLIGQILKMSTSEAKVALEKFRLDLIMCLLANGADPNSADQDGNTILHTALNKGMPLELIQLLLQKGANPNIENARGKAVLQASIEMDDFQIALRWCASDPLIAVAWGKGKSEALVAARKFRLNLIRWLLTNGANPNSTDQDGNTILHTALNKGIPLELIQLLLQKGANPNIENAKGKTVPQALMEMRNFQIAWGWCDSSLSLSNAWQMNKSRVKNAAEAFRTNLMKCLLKSVDVNRAGADANIALQTGYQSTSPSEGVVIKLLLTANANATNEERSTPLHMAFSKGFSFKVIKWLLRNGEDPNIRNAEGKTLLQALMELEDSEIASRWGKYFSLIGAASDKGKSEAQLAAEGFRIALMECVLEKGADPDIVNAALQTALKRKYSFAVIECLLNHKADPNEKDQDNNAALHIALNEGAPLDVIRLLLRKGANLGIENAHGAKPLQTLMGMVDTKIASRWRDSCPLVSAAWEKSEPEALLAARKFRIDLAECLLQGGADPRQAAQNRTAWCVLLDHSSLFRKEIASHFKAYFQVENFNPLCNEEDLQILKLAKDYNNEELVIFLGSKMENTWEREIKVHYFRSFCIYLDRLWKRFQVWRLGEM